RVIDRCGNRRSDAGHANLADTAGSVFAHQRVGNIQEGYVDLRQVRAGGHDVVGEVVVDRVAVARVVDGIFEHTHAHAHVYAACDLVGRHLLIDDSATVDDGDDAAYAQPGDSRVPLDLSELGPEGVHGIVGGPGVGALSSSVAVAGCARRVGHAEDLMEGNAALCGLVFPVDASCGKSERGRVLLQIRRARSSYRCRQQGAYRCVRRVDDGGHHGR